MKAGPRATLSEQTLGVDNIDFDVDNGKASSEATVTARINLLGFPPGSVVELEDCGPADGRWLVHTVERGVFDAAATVTLKRVTQPLPEPAASTTTVSSASSGVGGSSIASLGGTETPEVDRAYAAAQAITAKRYPYVWGAGHAHAGTPDNPHMRDPQTGQIDPGIGFDCSGLQGAMLSAAGMGFQPGDPVYDSGHFATQWGDPGEGQYLTIWANAVHVWSAFKTAQGWQHFGTGDWGSGNEFLGLKPQMHPTAGFTPRHWPGT
jgi:hypothetical protein